MHHGDTEARRKNLANFFQDKTRLPIREMPTCHVKLRPVISRRLLAGLLLVFHGVPGLSQGRQLDAGKLDRASDASVSSTRTYRNETIGFTYPLPDGFSLNEDAAKQSQLRPGTGTLFVADQVLSGRPCINRVVVNGG